MKETNSSLNLIFPSLNEAHMQALAADLAQQCLSGDCIALRGDLGAGKTTFARAFIQSLQHQPEEVVSPTFTLVQTYPTRSGNTIWHYDLYRLKNAQELAEIGLDEALADGITLIEWPELAQGLLPAGTLDVSLFMGDNNGERSISLRGQSAQWQARLECLKDFT